MTSTLHAVQAHLEYEAITLGRERFLAGLERRREAVGALAAPSSAPLLVAALEPAAAALAVLLNSRGRNHARGPSVAAVRKLDHRAAAYIGLVMAISGATRQEPLAVVCRRIGEHVENEVRASWVPGEDPAAERAHERALARIRRLPPRHRPAALRALEAKRKPAPTEWEDWGPGMLARTGAIVLNAVLVACPDVFAVTLGPLGRKCLDVTPGAAAMIARDTESASWCQPIFRPMLTPPRPWDAVDTGAYLTRPMARHVKLIRSHDRAHREALQAAISTGQAQPLLDAVNAIQAVPWRVNAAMVDIVEACAAAPMEGPDMPGPLVDIPSAPADIETWPEEDRKAWRRVLWEKHSANRRTAAKQAALAQDIGTARLILDHDRLCWFPHSIDFRGRVYPVPHFNPQRGDSVRCMLEFAEGVPLGPDGLFWLAVHVANCGDFDRVAKRSFDDRVAWVAANVELIAAVAEDPMAPEVRAWWSQAASPLQFVRACQEYAAASSAVAPAAFVSHLPVALDGSCSGLQHYSASLRDEAGAALVNLLPADAPSDIYGAVAAAVAARVEQDAREGDESVRDHARRWVGQVTRSTVKRPVMTFAYSSGEYGFRRQIMEDVMNPLARKVTLGQLDGHPFGPDRGWRAAGYLAKVIAEGVGGMVTGAVAGMAFLKTVAGMLARENKPLTWVTPLGLPVLHAYREWDTKGVILRFHGVTVPVVDLEASADGPAPTLARCNALLAWKPSTRIDKGKARSAVAPNAIHSLDAAHLLMTVLEAKARGIGAYALIHDSFGTRAGNCSRWGVLIRETMVRLYETFDIYEEVRRRADGALSERGRKRLPGVPLRGTLDLRRIIEAGYAFA